MTASRNGDDVTIRIIGETDLISAAEQADKALRALEAAGQRAGKCLAEKALRLGEETALMAREAARGLQELIDAETVERD